MSKKLFVLISILLISTFVVSACGPKAPKVPTGEVKLTLWTKEGEADGGFQFVKGLTDAFTAKYPNITFEVVNKEVETLREDFQTASLAGAAPDLLWTVNDHAGPFTTAGIIQPVGDFFDMKKYVPSVEMDKKVWAVPISSGNHLMLLYNKDLVKTPPATTDDFIKVAKELTKGDVYGFVYNTTEPFWLVPWLGGFGGKVFAEDGVTPTLNTPEMVNTLQFLYDLKNTDKVTPAEANYDVADALFKEGKAAMIIQGDWSLGGYSEALGDKLGVASFPKVSKTGKYPAPYTSGTYFMLPKDLAGEKLDAVRLFIEFVTNTENQLLQLTTLKRLPGLKAVLTNEAIAKDPILAGSAEDMSHGTPQPSVIEMRCNWDSMKPEMQAVLAGSKTPADAAKAMQSAAETCIKQLE